MSNTHDSRRRRRGGRYTAPKGALAPFGMAPVTRPSYGDHGERVGTLLTFVPKPPAHAPRRLHRAFRGMVTLLGERARCVICGVTTLDAEPLGVIGGAPASRTDHRSDCPAFRYYPELYAWLRAHQ